MEKGPGPLTALDQRPTRGVGPRQLLCAALDSRPVLFVCHGIPAPVGVDRAELVGQPFLRTIPTWSCRTGAQEHGRPGPPDRLPEGGDRGAGPCASWLPGRHHRQDRFRVYVADCGGMKIQMVFSPTAARGHRWTRAHRRRHGPHVFKAKGLEVASRWSRTTPSRRPRELIAKAGDRLLLPVDAGHQRKGPKAGLWSDLDRGCRARRIAHPRHRCRRPWRSYGDILKGAKMVVWNGPRACSRPRRSPWHERIARLLATPARPSVIGGGDSAAARGRPACRQDVHIPTAARGARVPRRQSTAGSRT